MRTHKNALERLITVIERLGTLNDVEGTLDAYERLGTQGGRKGDVVPKNRDGMVTGLGRSRYNIVIGHGTISSL